MRRDARRVTGLMLSFLHACHTSRPTSSTCFVDVVRTNIASGSAFGGQAKITVNRLLLPTLLFVGCGDCSVPSHPFDVRELDNDLGADAEVEDVSSDLDLHGDTPKDAQTGADADAPDFELRCDTVEEDFAQWWEENQRCTRDSDCTRVETNYLNHHHSHCSCAAGVAADATGHFELQLRYQTCVLDPDIPLCCLEDKGPVSCTDGYCY